MTATTRPATYRSRLSGRTIQAVQWLPDNPAAVGVCVGWLMSLGVNFHHPDGAGGTTTLAIRCANGEEITAEPGNWIAYDGGRWAILGTNIFAGAFDEEQP